MTQHDEATYRSIFDAANDAIFVHDSETGAILDVNRKMTEMYGYVPDEARQLSVDALSAGMPPYTQREALRWLKKAGAGEPQIFEWLAKAKSGRLFWVEVNIKRAVIGGKERLLAIVRDIGERKCAEEALRKAHDELEARVAARTADLQRLSTQLRLLLESTDEGIYGADLGERCTFVNQSAAKMLGYRPEEILGQHTHQLFHHSHADGSPYPMAECPLFQAIREGRSRRVSDEVLWRRDGTPFPVELAAHPVIEDGHVRGGLVTFLDITKRKRAEQEREEYIHTISHDLRAPLTVIQGQAQMLERTLGRRAADSPPRRSAEAIRTSAKRMNAMIQDLVDAAGIEAGQLRMDVRPLDLHAGISDLKERLAAVGGERIRVEAPEKLPQVSADPDRVERILTNLLTNALKYSLPGTPVTVTLTKRKGEVVTAVSDRGPGIPPDALPHLFERYYRAREAREHRAGLGLGLYIAKGLVEAHGGRIWVESRAGQGSTFYFTLPAARRGVEASARR